MKAGGNGAQDVNKEFKSYMNKADQMVHHGVEFWVMWITVGQMWRKTKKILKGLNLYKVVNYNYISFNCIDNIINIRYDSYANKS